MTPQQEKERAWQFLTLLSNQKGEIVSMFPAETKKLQSLLPSLQPKDVMTNTEGDVTTYVFDRKQVIQGLKLKYQFHSKNMRE